MIFCLVQISGETGYSGFNLGLNGKAKLALFSANPERFSGESREPSQIAKQGSCRTNLDKRQPVIWSPNASTRFLLTKCWSNLFLELCIGISVRQACCWSRMDFFQFFCELVDCGDACESSSEGVFCAFAYGFDS